MLWLVLLILMLVIAAAPGIYLLFEQRAHAHVSVDLSDSPVETPTDRGQ